MQIVMSVSGIELSTSNGVGAGGDERWLSGIHM